LTYQEEFGGAWTQQKLEALSKYLKAYTTTFEKNPRAQYYSISYVDAFAGTGSLKRPETGGLAELLPQLEIDEEEYRKGSVKRALEIEPPFDEYVFVEKSEKKCKEPRAIDFFVARLKTEFLAVSEPLPLYTSRGLLFMLFFAAGNAASAKTGLKIANQIIGPTTKHT